MKKKIVRILMTIVLSVSLLVGGTTVFAVDSRQEWI